MPVKDLQLHLATVLGKRMETPGMVRLTLGGTGMAGWQTTGIGDEYLRLFFPDAVTGELVLPRVDERGLWQWPEGKNPCHTVCYTVRRVGQGEIDVDFVVHDGGRASDWAQAAGWGAQILLGNPRGLYAAPADARWQLFVCDETGLPALGRLLEQLAPDVEARVIAEVSQENRQQQLASPADVKIVWLTGGNGHGPSRLEEAARSVRVPQGPTYAWVAAERKTAQPLRKYFRHELSWPGERYSVVTYWTAALAEWNAAWKALDPSIKSKIDDLWASQRDPEEVADAVEALTAPFGL
jgi:NADPH-dependent ferric siderophore reductase